MNYQPIVVEELIDAPVSKIWKAITNKDEMKKWYFELEDFRAEKGFEFEFVGGPSPEKQYMHLCNVTEVIPEKKLTYSWCYEGYPGMSHVTFDLEGKDKKTLVRLTHEGLASFPKNNPDFARENFVKGWDQIIHTSLKEFLKA